MKIEEMSLKELALYVSHHLRKHAIEVVLTGGACVTIYTENKYISYDLDFVPLHYPKARKIREALEEIGFMEESGYFKHPKTNFFVEFVAQPLAIGEEPVTEIEEMRVGESILRLLSPTDCVKDRLAAYYHWKDKQALEQALLVCRDQVVDLREVERWSENEGMGDKFRGFKRMLRK